MTNDESQMTKWPADECLGRSPDEIAFWGFEPAESRQLLVEEDAPPIIYHLEKRTARFGKSIIRCAKKLRWSPVNTRLIDQLVGAGTSVGANYGDADDGVSRADFKHRIGICRKEARETKFFLRVIASAEPLLIAEGRGLWKEAHALHCSVSRIWRSTKL